MREYGLTVGGVVFAVMVARLIQSLSSEALWTLLGWGIGGIILFAFPVWMLVTAAQRRERMRNEDEEEDEEEALVESGEFVVVEVRRQDHGR